MSAAYVVHCLRAQIEGVCRSVCHELICQRIVGNVCVMGRGIAAERCFLGVTKGLMWGIIGVMGSWAKVSCFL